MGDCKSLLVSVSLNFSEEVLCPGNPLISFYVVTLWFGILWQTVRILATYRVFWWRRKTTSGCIPPVRYLSREAFSSSLWRLRTPSPSGFFQAVYGSLFSKMWTIHLLATCITASDTMHFSFWSVVCMWCLWCVVGKMTFLGGNSSLF